MAHSPCFAQLTELAEVVNHAHNFGVPLALVSAVVLESRFTPSLPLVLFQDRFQVDTELAKPVLLFVGVGEVEVLKEQ